MKNRGGRVGQTGMHDLIAALQRSLPKARFHLIGHSFGCVVVSSILGGVKGVTPLPRPVDSVALLQGAVAFGRMPTRSPTPAHKGYFNGVLTRKLVRGPIITTQSRFDKAVGDLLPAGRRSRGPGGFRGTSREVQRGWEQFGIQGANPVVVEDASRKPRITTSVPAPFITSKAARLSAKWTARRERIPISTGPQVAHAIWQAASV